MLSTQKHLSLIWPRFNKENEFEIVKKSLKKMKKSSEQRKKSELNSIPGKNLPNTWRTNNFPYTLQKYQEYLLMSFIKPALLWCPNQRHNEKRNPLDNLPDKHWCKNPHKTHSKFNTTKRTTQNGQWDLFLEYKDGSIYK